MKQFSSYLTLVIISLLVFYPLSYLWLIIVNQILSSGDWEMAGIVVLVVTLIPLYALGYLLVNIIYRVLAPRFKLGEVNNWIILIILILTTRAFPPTRLFSSFSPQTASRPLALTPVSLSETTASDNRTVNYQYQFTFSTNLSRSQAIQLQPALKTYKRDGTPFNLVAGQLEPHTLPAGETTLSGVLVLSPPDIQAVQSAEREIIFCLLDQFGSMLVCHPSTLSSLLSSESH